MATTIKLFKKEQVGEVIQRLGEADINFSLTHMSGSEFKITAGPGDPSEYQPALSQCRIEWGKIEEVISALAYEAAHTYPDSDFSQWYGCELGTAG